MRKKVKYNLLFAIHDMRLDRAFEEYKLKLSPDISENRKARAFLTHFSRVIGSYKRPNYIVGQEKFTEELDSDLITLIRDYPLFDPNGELPKGFK